jgi:hypothetical protein
MPGSLGFRAFRPASQASHGGYERSPDVANFINPFYTDTLITNSLYSKLMSVSIKLRNQDSTNQITSILDDLESDLNYLKNKPANDVRDFFD